MKRNYRQLMRNIFKILPFFLSLGYSNLSLSATITGTGFFITTNGYIATNHHVIANASAITVKDSRGKTYPAAVVHSDRANDLALLKIEGEFSALSIAKSSSVRRGDAVFTLGFPNTQLQGNAVKFTDGTISSLSGIRDEPNTFQISVPIQPGNSGGPLVNREGVVIGVVVAKLSATAALNSGSSIPEAVNYAVKSNYLLELLEQDQNVRGQIYQNQKNTKEQSLPDLVSRAEQSIVFIVATIPSRSNGGTTLKVAIDPTYSPFTFKDQNNRPTGFDVDIAKAICVEIKRRCIFIEQDWDSMLPGLQAKNYDVIISSMSITESRLKQVDFTDRYYKTPSFLVLKKGTLYSGSESIKGKRIGVLKNSPQEKFAQGELSPFGADVISYEEQNQVYSDISAELLDGTVADYVELSGGFLSNFSGKNFRTFGPPLYTSKYFGLGVGIAIRKGEYELQNELNSAIKTIRSNGIYKSINNKYFDLDVYGH